MPLSHVPVGSRVRIDQLPEGDGLHQRLLALGIHPGVQLELVRRGCPGGLLHLAHGLQEFMLRQEQAAGITVSIVQT
ncbi:MAG: FeoA family protein [Synechococcaceae cyanobacterium]|nr:FeoA family protein [Synechococcaceae cyanobacterium]